MRLSTPLSAHIVHINLNTIFHTHVEDSPTETVFIRHYMETHAHMHAHTHARAHTHIHPRTHACTHARTHARTHAHTETRM